jgi:hypothetical protein
MRVKRYVETGLETCDLCGSREQVVRVADRWLCARHTCRGCRARPVDRPYGLCEACRPASPPARRGQRSS